MWDKHLYDETLDYFLNLSDTDPVARRIIWLLVHVGVVPMYEDVPMYNRVIEVILTQRIKFEKSGAMKKKLSKIMGTRFFTPIAFLDVVVNRRDELLSIGIEDYVISTCQRVTERVITILQDEDGLLDDRDLSIAEIEEMRDIKGFSEWSVNVACINYTFSPRYNGFPYSIVTNHDPVIKRGIYWMTGISPYNAVLDQFTEKYSPYAGVITRYVWEAFNYNRIYVKVPPSYRKWWNKGSRLPDIFPDILSELDKQLAVHANKGDVQSHDDFI